VLLEAAEAGPDLPGPHRSDPLHALEVALRGPHDGVERAEVVDHPADDVLRDARDVGEHAIAARGDGEVERARRPVVAEQLDDALELDQVLVAKRTKLLERGGRLRPGAGGVIVADDRVALCRDVADELVELQPDEAAFGAELDQDYDVVEADMAWWKVKDEDFVGKAAHVAAREREPAATLCTLTMIGNERFPLGREPVVREDGSPLVDAKGRRSYVTSAGMGPSLGKYVLMSYLPPGDHGPLFVEYMGEQYPVTVEVVGSRPPFDPDNARIRS